MKEVILYDAARQGLKKGVDLISNAVKATLGPRGRNVVYGFHYGYPIATKDGVTVARQIEAKDQLEQLGVLLIRQVAQQTADDSGDGTTTASVLAQSIYTEGLRSLNTGANPILIKRGIEKAVNIVLEYINQHSQTIDDDNSILNVSTLSANNDKKIGELIYQAIKKVGEQGIVTIEDNHNSDKTEIVVVEGLQLNEGMISPFFMTDPEKLLAEYDNPKVMLVDGDIVDLGPMTAIIEEVIVKNKRPLLIICHGSSGPALQAMASSRANNGIPLLLCRAPQFGRYREDMLSDVGIITGSVIVGGNIGIRLKDLTYEQLGECERVTADRYSTTIVGGKGEKDKITARIALLDQEMEDAVSDYDKEKIQERLAKLTTGVAVIKVGSSTEVERKEIKMRVEDSLHATKAAIESGIVPGGGVVYLKASDYLANLEFDKVTEEEKIGLNIIVKSLRSPIKQIAENSGVSGEEIIANIFAKDQEGFNYGYDFLNNNYCDLIKSGVIDPTKVIKNALKNAAEVASMLLTTEVAVYESEEDVVPPARTPKPRTE